jgi:hypothetical protein
VLTGHVTLGGGPAGDAIVSTTPNALIVTFPLLVTTMLNVINWPESVIVLGLAVFTAVSAGDWVTPTVAFEGLEAIVVPPGVVPLAVALSVNDPASMSAWVAT